MHIRCNSNLVQFIAFLSFSGKYRINGFESNMQNRALEYFGKKCFFFFCYPRFFYSIFLIHSLDIVWWPDSGLLKMHILLDKKIVCAVAILVKFCGFLIQNWKIKTLNECEMLKADQLWNLTLVFISKHSLHKVWHSDGFVISRICHFHFHFQS